MYTPVTPTLLPSSMFNTCLVSAPGSINDLIPSPALKPMLASPHWISWYMKNTNVICRSAAITTWNVFACEKMHFLVTVNCYVMKSIITTTIVRAHDVSLRLYSITIKDSKQTIMYADTWDAPSYSATLSHVTIISVVGVKLPEDGNNSCSWSRALWRRATLDVVLKKMFPNLLMSMSFQKGAISAKPVNGNVRGMNWRYWDRNERTPFVFTCEPESLKEVIQ